MPVNDNDWNDSHEKGLYLLHKYSNEMYKKYHTNYNKYKEMLQKYRIPIIVLSSISGFLSISNSGYIPNEYNKWVSLVVGFSNLMVSLVSLIENFKKIDVTLTKSQDTYIAFKKINDEISIILRIPREERDEGGHVTLMKYFQQFEVIYNTAPILKNEVLDLLEIKETLEVGLTNNTTVNNIEISITSSNESKEKLQESADKKIIEKETPNISSFVQKGITESKKEQLQKNKTKIIKSIKPLNNIPKENISEQEDNKKNI